MLSLIENALSKHDDTTNLAILLMADKNDTTLRAENENNILFGDLMIYSYSLIKEASQMDEILRFNQYLEDSAPSSDEGEYKRKRKILLEKYYQLLLSIKELKSNLEKVKGNNYPSLT